MREIEVTVTVMMTVVFGKGVEKITSGRDTSGGIVTTGCWTGWIGWSGNQDKEAWRLNAEW